MNFAEAIRHLETRGFAWLLFRELFPFGDLSPKEGEYVELVRKSLELLMEHSQRELLMDLLDAQFCIFLEQLWAQNDQSTAAESPPMAGECHFALARLEINRQLRHEYELPRKDGRGAMMNLPEADSVFDRIVAHWH